ncbi:hypothetical protein QE418_001999 [Microbacterium testaceum]|uniref:Uncharacterized protein n=1 Tax=Microbacterium testaceum TaxID=2033 RepID=A0A4Y3QKK5_MICTE|nr:MULTISPECIES: hypothetical protein [Microbacterium]MDQ1112551.1 hypothetical protein [Microbacterium testaceum]MDR6096912.1 hypothetical protein [Microbacterium sp. SORGH_AS_0454]MDZ5146199.1 hypothetical protein [Microbacterium testaceum]RED00006.1 hypothetical protein DEU35_0986 [Microbacterium sp. AG157]WJS91287.1 hypothetical protein NYQ11_01655 [Microbacterium testaceum]
MGSVIRLDSEFVRANVSKVVQTSDELPAATIIGVVDGNGTEPAASQFTQLLRTRAETLGARVEEVRQYIAQNAAALSQAVQTLEERDEMNASDAQQVTAIIDAASTAPPAGVSPGASAGGQAGVRGALGLQ